MQMGFCFTAESADSCAGLQFDCGFVLTGYGILLAGCCARENAVRCTNSSANCGPSLTESGLLTARCCRQELQKAVRILYHTVALFSWVWHAGGVHTAHQKRRKKCKLPISLWLVFDGVMACQWNNAAQQELQQHVQTWLWLFFDSG